MASTVIVICNQQHIQYMSFINFPSRIMLTIVNVPVMADLYGVIDLHVCRVSGRCLAG